MLFTIATSVTCRNHMQHETVGKEGKEVLVLLLDKQYCQYLLMKLHSRSFSFKAV